MNKTAFIRGFEKNVGPYDNLDVLTHLGDLEQVHGITVPDSVADMYISGGLNFNPKNKSFVPKTHQDGVSFVNYLPVLDKAVKSKK